MSGVDWGAWRRMDPRLLAKARLKYEQSTVGSHIPQDVHISWEALPEALRDIWIRKAQD